jgi:DNA-binding protein Fis
MQDILGINRKTRRKRLQPPGGNASGAATPDLL